MIKGLGLSVPPSDLRGGERGWRLNQPPVVSDLINHDCNEASMKTWKGGTWRASRLVGMCRFREKAHLETA